MNGFDSGFFANLWHQCARQGQKISKLIATLLVATVFFLGMGTILLPVPTAQATMQLFCPGLDSVGNPYTATYVDGLFTEVRFDRTPSLPPVTSQLTYDTVNEQGEPVYRGGYLGAADVVLIDRSKGNVKPGSEVSVSVDNNWNQTRGVCGTSTPDPTPTALICPGLDSGGYPYTATYSGRTFTQVRFDRSPNMPPVTSELTYDGVNGQGEPIYRGGYLGAADVILVDLSKDNVQPGSEVSVSVDNLWNQQRGVCRTPTPTPTVLTCPGSDYYGDPYTATYKDGSFTTVRFDRTPSLPPVTSQLYFYAVNDQGEPIYQGDYLGGADRVFLIDLSKDNVQTGSEVSVSVDNLWNQRRGVCGS